MIIFVKLIDLMYDLLENFIIFVRDINVYILLINVSMIDIDFFPNVFNFKQRIFFLCFDFDLLYFPNLPISFHDN